MCYLSCEREQVFMRRSQAITGQPEQNRSSMMHEKHFRYCSTETQFPAMRLRTFPLVAGRRAALNEMTDNASLFAMGAPTGIYPGRTFSGPDLTSAPAALKPLSATTSFSGAQEDAPGHKFLWRMQGYGMQSSYQDDSLLAQR